MGKVQPIAPESSESWYETLNKSQPDSVVLKGADRDMFNYAFECRTTEANGLAHKGFLTLAKKGSAISQYFLGELYLQGMGVLQDFVRAHMWFNIAASQGHKKARSYLVKLTSEMTADQVAEAQKMARKWVAKHRSDS